MSELLKITDFSVNYKIGKKQLSAIKNVDLTVNEGEITAIVGESGCGKSTLAYSIVQLLDKRKSFSQWKYFISGKRTGRFKGKRYGEDQGKRDRIYFSESVRFLKSCYKKRKSGG